MRRTERHSAGGARLVARFLAHAPEHIQDSAGRWWMTTCGWIGYPRPPGCEGGKVCIAPLEWRPQRKAPSP